MRSGHPCPSPGNRGVAANRARAGIVRLIGEGLSNRAIAERLTLSVRTVESYVYRAMMKTGTASRDELAALMPRRKGAR